MGNIIIKINRSDVSKADVDQLQNIINGLPPVKQKQLGENYNSFAIWLKDTSPRLYKNLYPYLKDVWSQIQKSLEIVGEIAMRTVVTAVTPIVGLIEGVKEGLDNGLEAGVRKGFKTMGDLLDEIFS